MDTSDISKFISQNVDILNNLAKNMLPIQRLIKGSAYLLGLLFAFKALYSLKVYGEARTMMSSNTSIKEPLTYLFVAAVLLIFPQALTVMLTSTFGSPNILAYAPVDSPNPAFQAAFGSQSQAGKSLAIIIQTVGYIAFVRGWILIARAAGQGQQPGTTGKGLMHVLGGILAINIVSTLQIVNNTLYGS